MNTYYVKEDFDIKPINEVSFDSTSPEEDKIPNSEQN